ncbi:MAG: hypothetical protein ACE5HE_06790 [Phycisphaerae bacterium]
MRKRTFLFPLATSVALVMIGCAPTGKRVTITAEKNPTTLAGRGDPSIDDERCPSAWIYIDGHEGSFIEKDGVPQVQWVIAQPVSTTPTFRVEVLDDLLGTPKDFKCILYPYETTGESSMGYGIAAEDGAFKIGHDYPLLQPGPEFIIRVAGTDEMLTQIDPLAPGSYLLTAKIENREMGLETLAVTYFTVGEAVSAAD